MRSVRLLLAIADQPERERVAQTLNAEGGQIVGQTGDGLSAVRLSNALKPDVAILDSGIENSNGCTITGRLQEASGASVVLLTEPGQLQIARHLAHHGAAGCLLKPVRPDELCLAVIVANRRRAERNALMRRLRTAERRLRERQDVERAKALLMKHKQIGEDLAYNYLRQLSMRSRKSMGDVAQLVLLDDLLGN